MKSILVVEDDPLMLEILLRNLSEMGIQAEAAHDGQRGLDLWKETKLGIILTDCHMPRMDGFEMAQHIREAEEDGSTDPVTIVAITADVSLNIAERCESAGINYHLQKPVSREQLRFVLENANLL